MQGVVISIGETNVDRACGRERRGVYLQDEVVQRLADLAVSGGGRARGELPGVAGEGGWSRRHRGVPRRPAYVFWP